MDVDVVICAKNRANDLERILPQISKVIPFKNLIIVYGTSSDRTRQIAEEHSEKVFWDGNKGLGAARRLGISKATSEIVAMVDTDIQIPKGWFNQLIGNFQDPEVAAVMGTCIYGYGCRPIESYWEYNRRTAHSNYGCHNTLFKRDIVLSVGNFDENISGAGEDHDLYMRLLAAGYKWVWVRNAKVYHPMTMWEYAKHARWWAKSSPNINRVADYVRDKSLPRLYAAKVSSLVEATKKGITMSFSVHPTFLVYYPAISVMCTLDVLKEYKKVNKRTGAQSRTSKISTFN